MNEQNEPMTVTPDEIAAFESRLAEFARSLNPTERTRLQELLFRAIHGPDADTVGFITPDDSLPALLPFFAGPRSDITVADPEEDGILKAPPTHEQAPE
jgi:hypothetical protein